MKFKADISYGIWVLTFICLTILSVLIVSSCHQSKDNEKCVFRYNQVYPVTSLDPAFARNQSNITAVDHLYNTLVQLDDSLKLRPCIAKSWQINETGTSFDFTIDTTIKFHDNPCFMNGIGRKVGPDDVVYSLNRIIDQEVGSPGSWIFADRVDSIKPFEVIDPVTVRINLIRPFMPFLQLMTMQYCAILPKEAVEYYGKSFRANPVGTGPFYLKKWIEGQTMILHKNPDYFEKENGTQLPYVDVVRVSFIGDRKTAFLELIQGKLDFVSGFDPSMAIELFNSDGTLKTQYASKINLHKSPYLSTEYLGINLLHKDQNSPLMKKDFRLALNYGFDREGLLKTIKRGIGMQATSSFSPYGLPTFVQNNTATYSFDPVKAKSHLKASGYLDTEFDERPILTLFTAKDYADHCLFILKQWEQIGIRCRLELAEGATIREMMRNGQALFFRGNWLADYPDEENFLTVFYSKNPAPPNYTRFKNKTYDALYESSLVVQDDKKRAELYQKMEEILINESPVVLLYYDAISNFTSPSINNYRTNPLNILKVKSIRKTCMNE